MWSAHPVKGVICPGQKLGDLGVHLKSTGSLYTFIALCGLHWVQNQHGSKDIYCIRNAKYAFATRQKAEQLRTS